MIYFPETIFVLSYTKSVALSLTSILGLCLRREWDYPIYDIYKTSSGYTCHVLVHGREYLTDLAYASDRLARENAAMRAFMVCRSFSVNGGMLARNGVVQGLPASEIRKGRRDKAANNTCQLRFLNWQMAPVALMT
jgi:hypothetical protein